MGWIMGAVPLADLVQNLVAGVLRHDHNQRGTHGADGIVNYEPLASRAVKILTAPGIAAVGASTRQGLLVTSSFPGRQRPTCHLTEIAQIG